MTKEEVVRILALHNGCLIAQENGECRYNHLGRCEPCRYFTDDEEFTEAESAAIEALQERKTGEWHPYPKEKPDVPVSDFLVTKKIGYTYGICVETWSDGVFLCARNVIAWMPLPEPYKEVDE